MDENYQTYVNRLVRLTLPTAYQGQLTHIQKSPKFKDRQPIPFPGYTLITPPQGDDLINHEFYIHLARIQQELIEKIPDLLIPVPTSSFHFTAANLIWEERYRQSRQSYPDYEQQIRNAIQNSFDQYRANAPFAATQQWQVLGLLIYPRALVVGLVPQDEAAYEGLTLLRRAVYQNRDLIGLGVDQQYHFTAHITLGYFDDIPDAFDRDRLVELLIQINDRWLDQPPPLFTLQQVQLRQFENMVQYDRKPGDPVIFLEG